MSNIAIDDSKIPWLGVIPKTWSLTTISAFYELRNEKVSDKDYPPVTISIVGKSTANQLWFTRTHF